MKIIVAMLACLLAAPAFAGEGQIPRSTLDSLGLAEMTVISDVQGTEVRGLSSNARAFGANLIFGGLFDPNTGSNASGAQANYGGSIDQNAGFQVVSIATQGPHSGSLTVPLDVTFNGNIFSGLIIGTAGLAASPAGGFSFAVGQ